MTMHSRTLIATLVALVAACALAVDLPADDATKRKRLAEYQSDPAHWQRLQANLTAFRALPPDERERIRLLDKAFHEQDQSGQARLKSVLERYSGWLSRLSPTEQATIADAPVGEKRLKLVEEILERQWQESLPKPDRVRLAKADAVERARLLELLHKEDDERRKLRLTARRAVDEAALFGSLPNQAAFKEALQLFVEESLRPQLSPGEELRLTAASGRLQGNVYLRSVFEIAESKGPVPFPGPAAPGKKRAYRSWKELPTEITSRFKVGDLNDAPSYVTAAEGKWPNLPLAVVKFANEKNYSIPSKLLGPTKADELPHSVQKFLKEELKLNEVDRSALSAAEGRWPDYPKKVKELADKAKLRVPGISLPGNEETWQRIKNFKPGPGRLQTGQ